MTNGLVVTITDELVAELERFMGFGGQYIKVSSAALRALLSERADLYSDIELLEHTIEGMHAQKAAHAGMADALLRSDKLLTEARREIAELKRDAERWQAFTNCARIRFFGWAGYESKDPYGNSPGNYRHFGAEFWSIHDAPTENPHKAIEILNGFADAAIDQAMQERQK